MLSTHKIPGQVPDLPFNGNTGSALFSGINADVGSEVAQAVMRAVNDVRTQGRHTQYHITSENSVVAKILLPLRAASGSEYGDTRAFNRLVNKHGLSAVRADPQADASTLPASALGPASAPRWTCGRAGCASSSTWQTTDCAYAYLWWPPNG